jgi:hypothetical protein
MADLLAIVSHDRSVPVDGDDFAELIARYESLRGPARSREAVSGGWVRACAFNRTSEAAAGIENAQNGDWAAWAGSLHGEPAAMTGPLESIDGQFALVRLEAGGSRARIAADPLGMKPVFAAVSDRRTYLSTSALALAAHLGSAPSRLGCEAFLRSGLQFGALTQWEGIERLRPAEYLEFGPGGRRRGVYWLPRREEGLDRLSLGDAAELCVERAVEAISARYGNLRPWLDLTGGFDSRLLALLSRRAGVEFRTNTVGGEDEEDVRLARRIAGAAGWPWTRIDLPADWAERLPDLSREALAWGDGHLDALSLAAVMLGHREKGETETTLLNGGGGEEFRDHPWGHELFGAGRSTSVAYGRLIAWRLLLPVDLSALRADPTAAVTSAFREELERRAEPFSSQSNVFQDDFLYAYKMTGHSGAYQAAGAASMDVEMPYYLRPILLTLVSLAPRHRRFHRLMREMMHTLDPAIASIQTETGGPAEPPRPGNLHRFAPYAWRRGKRFAIRARARLPRFGESAAATPDLRQTAQSAFVAGLAADGRLDPARMRSAALYDGARLADLLDRAARQPTAVDWAAVGRIVTVELALEAAGAGF